MENRSDLVIGFDIDLGEFKLEFSIEEYRRFTYSFENPFMRDEDIKIISRFYNTKVWDARNELEFELSITLDEKL